MKVLLAALLLATTDVLAQWSAIKPVEFEPLTSVPWDAKDATMDAVLAAIFREPNTAIRYPVLGAYLRHIPKGDIGKAFDLCVPLESTQNPDHLVHLFLPIWAERDPLACWAWVRQAFRLVGIEHGVLGYDSWTERLRITAQDLDAMRASRFWIRSEVLKAFPVAIDRSSLPKDERVRVMKEFTEIWFAAMASWPGHSPHGLFEIDAGAIEREGVALVEALRRKPETDALESISWSDPTANLRMEIAMRQLLQGNVVPATTLMAKAQMERPPTAENTRSWRRRPSDELLLLWAKRDPVGMTRWVDSLDPKDVELALRAKGLLLSRVDAATRKRWLAEVKGSPAEDGPEATLFENWAQWDLEAAMLAVVDAGNPEAARGLANSAVYGPWSGQPWNASRHAFGILTRFDFTRLPPRVADLVLDDCYSLMEQWDSMDVANAARFGFAYLLRTKYAPRERLIRFFSGEDLYADEGGMIDRTFCALRVWAVVRPEEMRKWIATIKDAEMRKALTWLLENPWGGG
jgi:hypothetical protein